MLADERTRTETHREWILTSPAHDDDVSAARAEANARWLEDCNTFSVSAVEFRSRDGEIVIGYTVDGEPLRGCDASCASGARLDLARAALVRDGYFTEPEVGDDIAPRLVEWLAHHRGRTAAAEDQRHQAEQLLRECDAARDAAQAAIARVRALAESWSQSRYVMLKSADPSLVEPHVRPVHEAADLLLAALADPEAEGGGR